MKDARRIAVACSLVMSGNIGCSESKIAVSGDLERDDAGVVEGGTADARDAGTADVLATPDSSDAAPDGDAAFVRDARTCESAIGDAELLPDGVALVASQLGGLGELQSDAANLYFASGRNLVRLPLSAPKGTPFTVLVSEVHPWWVLLDTSFLYWFDSPFGNAPSLVLKAPLEGGDPILLASGIGYPDALAIDDAHVFIADRGYEKLYSIPLEPADGGRPQADVLAVNVQLRSIAVKGAFVYFTEFKSKSVQRVPVAGGTPETLAPLESDPGGIAVDDDNVYFGDGLRLMKAPIAGGSLTKIGEGRGPIHRVVLDDQAVYFTDAVDFCGDIGRAPLDGSGSTFLVSYIPEIHGLTATKDSVYVSLATSQILRAAK